MASTQPQAPTQHDAPLLTHKSAMETLAAASAGVQRLYAHIPRLCAVLGDTLLDCVNDNGLPDSDPLCNLEQVLITQIRVEREIISAYNKHRLGGAVAEGNSDYREEDNLPDQLDTFPFHSEVVRRGFQLPALSLRPLYQVPEVDTAASTPGTGHTQTLSKRSGPGAYNYGKLAGAPLTGLAFPNGNITLAEMAAFLPESIKSWDVIDRIIGNGATSAALAQMINHFRDMTKGPIAANTIYRSMKVSMKPRAKLDAKWKTWSVGMHQDIADHDVDATSVSVAGFRHAGTSVAPAVPFQDLAKGVKMFPEGHDALDLTRCVQHCLEHPQEQWLYPDDFVRLVNHLPSGPAQVEDGHHDASVVDRWSTGTSARTMADTHRRKRSTHASLPNEDTDAEEDDNTIHEIFNKLRLKRKHDPPRRSPRPSKRSKTAQKDSSRPGALESNTRSQTQRRIDDLDSESDSDTYQGPGRMKKKTGPARISGRTRSFKGSYSVEDAMGADDDEMDLDSVHAEHEDDDEDEDDSDEDSDAYEE